jgi:hypothetical protein
MGYVHTLPASTCIVSSGDAGLRLARHHVENRMVPLIVLTDVTGRFHVIELTADDTVRLYEDLRLRSMQTNAPLPSGGGHYRPAVRLSGILHVRLTAAPNSLRHNMKGRQTMTWCTVCYSSPAEPGSKLCADCNRSRPDVAKPSVFSAGLAPRPCARPAYIYRI